MNKQDIKIGDYVKISDEEGTEYGVVETLNKKTVRIRTDYDYDDITLPYSKIEFVPPAILTEKELKAIVRYDKKYTDIIGENSPYNYTIQGNYDVTLDDFKTALTKLRELNYSVDEINQNWFFVLTDELSDVFDIYEWWSISVKKEKYSKHHALCYALMLMHEDRFDDALTLINEYYEDIDKPVLKKRYPDEYKEDFVRAYDDDNSLELATDDEICLFRKFATELCDVENLSGLKAVGYGCYCQNRAFEQNWQIAHDCIKKLYEKVNKMPEKAFYANTLGYIYYYGRCNNDIPQYEEAYRYFSFGAFNRIYESQYKIADMYRNGYGVEKSPETAECIIRQLYDENIEYMLDGKFDSKYADIALRLASTYCAQEDDDADYDQMLLYYMKADFAIRMRMETINYYGDQKVSTSIKNCLEKTKKEMGFIPRKKATYYSLYGFFYEMLQCGMKLKMSVRETKNGKYQLTFKNHQNNNKKLFITVPEIELCGLYDKITVTAHPYKPFNLKKFGSEIVFDKCNYNDLLLDGNVVFSFNDCVFEIRKKSKKCKKYRLASVCFSKDGHSYDYLCDDSIAVGDFVIVKTYDGEQKVAVTKIKLLEESELSLPVKKYKHILKKA